MLLHLGPFITFRPSRDAMLLLRPESSGFGFLVQIRAFDLAGITKFKKKTRKENTKRILDVVVK